MVIEELVTLNVEDLNWQQVNQKFDELGWTDGLPIVPPTKQLVQAMMDTLDFHPKDCLGQVAPSYRDLLIEDVAIQAVMAGCAPQDFPIVVAAAKALLHDDFLLTVVQTTTHSVTPLVIVSGPLADKNQIHSGSYDVSFNWKSNAAIQRAVNLICHNIGGIHGLSGKHTFNQLIKYHYCFAENQKESPWASLREEMGFPIESTTVTICAAEPPHHYENWGGLAKPLLASICDSMVTVGCRSLEGGENTTLLVLCPEHANALANGGFSKQDVKRFIYEHARIPLYRITSDHIDSFSDEWKKFYSGGPLHYQVPMSSSPEDILILVSGGGGPNSLIVPNLTGPKPITLAVTNKKGDML